MCALIFRWRKACISSSKSLTSTGEARVGWHQVRYRGEWTPAHIYIHVFIKKNNPYILTSTWLNTWKLIYEYDLIVCLLLCTHFTLYFAPNPSKVTLYFVLHPPSSPPPPIPSSSTSSRHIDDSLFIFLQKKSHEIQSFFSSTLTAPEFPLIHVFFSWENLSRVKKNKKSTRWRSWAHQVIITSSYHVNVFSSLFLSFF